MASSEPYLISNPKENNRDLLVTFVNARGETKNLALLRPGESVRSDRADVRVQERHRPAQLLVEPDGTVRPDNQRRGPLMRRKQGRGGTE